MIKLEDIVAGLEPFEYALDWESVRRAHGYHKSRRYGQGFGRSKVVPEYVSPKSRVNETVSEKRGETCVNVRLELRNITVFYLIDCSNSMMFGAPFSKRLTAAFIAAVIAKSVKIANDRLCILGFTDAIEEAMSIPLAVPDRYAPYRIVRAASSFQSARKGAKGFRDVTGYIPMREPCLVFIASDFFPRSDFMPTLEELATVHDCVPIVLRDEWEKTLPVENADVSLEDSESGRVSKLWLSAKTAEEFHRRMQEEDAALRRKFHRIGAKPIWVSISREEAEKDIVRAMKREIAKIEAYFAERLS